MKLSVLPSGTGLDQAGNRWRRTVDGRWVEDPEAPIDQPRRNPAQHPDGGTREQRIERAVPLAMANFHKFAGTLPAHVDRDALRGAALEALLKAVDRYNPQLGQSFNSYVSQVVWFAMLDELRHLDPNPRHARRRGEQMQEVSLDQPIGDTEGLTVGDAFPSPVDVHEQVAAIETIRHAFGCLTDREREIVTCFYRGATGAEIAARLGVSESRVCQIRARAVRRMQAAADGDTQGRRRMSSPSRQRRRAAA